METKFWMKHFSVLLMLLAVSFTFVACDSDDDNAGEEEPQLGYNQLEYFQNSIVRVTDDGEFCCRVSGKVLNESDTTVVSVAAVDLEDAKEQFRSWMAPDAVINETSDGFRVNLADEYGSNQGTLVFSTASAANGVIAEVTAEGADLKHFSKVQFLYETAWPNNAMVYSPYAVGDMPIRNGRKYVVIRRATATQDGIMISITGKTTGTPYSQKECMGFSEGKMIGGILRTNWNVFVEYFKTAGMTLDNGRYWTTAQYFGRLGYRWVNFREGKDGKAGMGNKYPQVYVDYFSALN